MTTRTPQDSALEHAEHLAKATDRLIKVVNSHAALQLRMAESDDVSDVDEHDSQVSVDEALRSARNMAYEFRKRRDRALRDGSWLPIESAPKDGTPIILGREPDEEDEAGFSGQGRWHEEDHDGPDNMGHDAGFMDDQFDYFKCARSFGNPAYQHQGVQPTRWQPLPPPPSTKGVE